MLTSMSVHFRGFVAKRSLEKLGIDRVDVSMVGVSGITVILDEGGARGKLEAVECVCLNATSFGTLVPVFGRLKIGVFFSSFDISSAAGIIAGGSRRIRGDGAMGLTPCELMLRLSASACCCVSRFASRISRERRSRFSRSCISWLRWRRRICSNSCQKVWVIWCELRFSSRRRTCITCASRGNSFFVARLDMVLGKSKILTICREHNLKIGHSIWQWSLRWPDVCVCGHLIDASFLIAPPTFFFNCGEKNEARIEMAWKARLIRTTTANQTTPTTDVTRGDREKLFSILYVKWMYLFCCICSQSIMR